MRRKFTITALFIFLLGLSPEIFPQSAGINFMMGFPQGDFKKSIDRMGFGAEGFLTLWTVNPSMPFTLGLDGSYMTYGSESRNEPFSTTIPDVTVGVNRTNNIVNFHLLLQIMPPAGNVRPYIEGLWGGSYLYTQTQINSSGNFDKEVASSTNFDDWAWSYGGGGGLMIKVHEMENNDEETNSPWKVTGIWIDLKARYMLGSEAEYLKEGSMRIEQGKVLFTPSRSKTDLITAHLGVTVLFN
ncbi:MAG TPA: hypothetical protein VHO43_00845 [Ignavibacteriales bacterium]|nr:hypothetical protein [Ignavibacteriales bacterium]